MKMSDQKNVNMLNEISSGALVPNGVFDGIVYAVDDQLQILIDQFNNQIPDEIVIFCWDYDNKEALYVRKTDIVNGNIIWKYDVSLQMQMKYKKIDSVRLAVSINMGGKIMCGFIRNIKAAHDDLASHDRLICKLYSKDKQAWEISEISSAICFCCSLSCCLLT